MFYERLHPDEKQIIWGKWYVNNAKHHIQSRSDEGNFIQLIIVKLQRVEAFLCQFPFVQCMKTPSQIFPVFYNNIEFIEKTRCYLFVRFGTSIAYRFYLTDLISNHNASEMNYILIEFYILILKNCNRMDCFKKNIVRISFNYK